MVEKVFFRNDLVKQTPDGYILVGNRCAKCGNIAFPKADFCFQCLNPKMEEVELSRKGKLYSYTITRVPVGKFAAPHAIGIILLPEKVRLMAPLVMEREDLKIGTEMEMVIDTLWTEEDKEVIGYKFKAAE